MPMRLPFSRITPLQPSRHPPHIMRNHRLTTLTHLPLRPLTLTLPINPLVVQVRSLPTTHISLRTPRLQFLLPRHIAQVQVHTPSQRFPQFHHLSHRHPRTVPKQAMLTTHRYLYGNRSVRLRVHGKTKPYLQLNSHTVPHQALQYCLHPLRRRFQVCQRDSRQPQPRLFDKSFRRLRANSHHSLLLDSYVKTRIDRSLAPAHCSH